MPACIGLLYLIDSAPSNAFSGFVTEISLFASSRTVSFHLALSSFIVIPWYAPPLASASSTASPPSVSANFLTIISTGSLYKSYQGLSVVFLRVLQGVGQGLRPISAILHATRVHTRQAPTERECELQIYFNLHSLRSSKFDTDVSVPSVLEGFKDSEGDIPAARKHHLSFSKTTPVALVHETMKQTGRGILVRIVPPVARPSSLRSVISPAVVSLFTKSAAADAVLHPHAAAREANAVLHPNGLHTVANPVCQPRSTGLFYSPAGFPSVSTR